ncbi:MAG: hypothetical protein U5L00_02515 [Desulfovermiculus sp.]|nr:hypothetical protein [Desulfovermiculus sp.]
MEKYRLEEDGLGKIEETDRNVLDIVRQEGLLSEEEIRSIFSGYQGK